MPEGHDPFDLPAQQEAKALQDDAARLKQQVEVDDLKWLMGHKQGRRIVSRQLNEFGVYRLSHVTGDTHETAFNEGNRNHGLKLIAMIHEHCPERFTEMVKEQKDGRRSNGNTGDRR